MERLQEYCSSYATENISLAEASYNLFRPYLHTYQWARDDPSHGPKTVDIASAIRNRGKPGSHTFFTANGRKYTLKKLQPWVFKDCITKQNKLFYVSNEKRALLYGDADAHRIWQTDSDTEYAMELVSGLFDLIRPSGQYLFTEQSDRGHNAWAKIEIGNMWPGDANKIFSRLERAIRLHLAANECWADFELKGRISHFNENGFDRKQYGKLPINRPTWDFQRLREFADVEPVDIRILERLCDQIESKIPESTLIQWERVKEQRDAEALGQLREQYDAGFPDYADDDFVLITDELWELLTVRQRHFTMWRRMDDNAEPRIWLKAREFRPQSIREKVKPKVALAPATLSITANIPDNDENIEVAHPVSQSSLRNVATDDLRRITDSFERQSEALRRLSRRLRRVPSVTESLDFIRANNLFTGAWEQNSTGRRNRVRDILRFIARTFDASKLKRGQVEIGKYDKWVRAKFPKGITVPEGPLTTRTGKIIPFRSGVRVSPDFISVFVDVVAFMLLDDPNEDGSLPQDRGEAIWKKLPVSMKFDNNKWKACREVFDRMQVIDVYDRNYESNKAMKWKPGRFFPGMDTWKRKKQKGIHPAVALVDFLSVLISRREEKHNTFLNNQCVEMPFMPVARRSRPPPGKIWQPAR